MSVDIVLLNQFFIQALAKAFASWPKPASLFEHYFHEQEKGERYVLVALKNDQVVGYITIKWLSNYKPFKDQGIPEINDLNVLSLFRNQGIGSLLMDKAELIIKEKSIFAGLGVGLYTDYGSAQRMYIKRGYLPDGLGVTYNYQQVEPGSMVKVDDELVLWLVKNLKAE